MFHWYVAHTQPQAESIAADNLANQGFSVYLPRYLKSRRHARRIESVVRPLFPRYLFVGFDTQLQQWRVIRSTRGIRELVCCGTEPARVPESVIGEIRGREDDRGLVRLNHSVRFSPGDRVQVVAGALADQCGLLDDIADDRRVIVLLSLLGRSVRVTVSVDALRRCA